MSVATSPFMNYVHTDANTQTTGTTLVNADGLSFPIDANDCRHFESTILWQSSGTASGIAFSFTGPASPVIIMVLAHLPALTDSQGNVAPAGVIGQINGYGVIAKTTTTLLANVTQIARLIGVIHNGPNPGTVQLQFASTTPAGIARVMAHSHIRNNVVEVGA